jgi:hypothetical protein
VAPMINPFDAGGYTLAEMTTAINILPNIYTRLGQINNACELSATTMTLRFIGKVNARNAVK